MVATVPTACRRGIWLKHYKTELRAVCKKKISIEPDPARRAVLQAAAAMAVKALGIPHDVAATRAEALEIAHRLTQTRRRCRCWRRIDANHAVACRQSARPARWGQFCGVRRATTERRRATAKQPTLRKLPSRRICQWRRSGSWSGEDSSRWCDTGRVSELIDCRRYSAGRHVQPATADGKGKSCFGGSPTCTKSYGGYNPGSHFPRGGVVCAAQEKSGLRAA